MHIEVEVRAPDLDNLTDAEVKEIVWGDPQINIQPVCDEEHLFGGAFYASIINLGEDEFNEILGRFNAAFAEYPERVYRIRKDQGPWIRVPEFNQDRDLGETEEEKEISKTDRLARITGLPPMVRDKIKVSIENTTHATQEAADDAQDILDAIDAQEAIEALSAGTNSAVPHDEFENEDGDRVRVTSAEVDESGTVHIKTENLGPKVDSVVAEDGTWDMNKLLGINPEVDKAEAEAAQAATDSMTSLMDTIAEGVQEDLDAVESAENAEAARIAEQQAESDADDGESANDLMAALLSMAGNKVDDVSQEEDVVEQEDEQEDDLEDAASMLENMMNNFTDDGNDEYDEGYGEQNEDVLFCVMDGSEMGVATVVIVTPKKFWEENGYLFDQHHRAYSRIPAGIGEDSESIFSTDFSEADTMQKMLAVSGFEYSKDLEDFMKEGMQ